MQQTFTNALGSSPYDEEKVKEAITTLNDKRKERLFLLLDYIEDQAEYSVKELSRLGGGDSVKNTRTWLTYFRSDYNWFFLIR